MTFYASDLFNMDQSLFKDMETDFADVPNRTLPRGQMPSSEVLLWTKLISIADLVVNQLDDYLIKIDTFQEPLRELLCQFYMYSEN